MATIRKALNQEARDHQKSDDEENPRKSQWKFRNANSSFPNFTKVPSNSREVFIVNQYDTVPRLHRKSKTEQQEGPTNKEAPNHNVIPPRIIGTTRHRWSSSVNAPHCLQVWASLAEWEWKKTWSHLSIFQRLVISPFPAINLRNENCSFKIYPMPRKYKSITETETSESSSWNWENRELSWNYYHQSVEKPNSTTDQL